MIILTINYAHRGASGNYPENTMLAFEKAIEMGATGIETDVQMTKDGELVILHDEQLNRTTNGNGLLKDYSLKEIKKLDAGSWFSQDYSSCTIPTLKEFLELTSKTKLKINLELKSNIIQYPNIEEKVIDMIYKYNMDNKVILSGFNHYSMVKCKEISSNIKTGLLYMSGLYKPETYIKYVVADALHPYFYALNQDIITGIQKSGIMINTFTVNDEKYMKFFASAKVDGIITNYPEKLKIILGE
ncbi:glycerophosphodiester phosphodiesterase [Clostridium grantii]|uniref:glycerophosphodiester phosphodiesterase n=1 Tax=Clostridium grantii TaxID=40575 RepID=UPI0009347909|nr:glycerophosphodiester phosphodiesterase [Clostridium grantii]